MEHALKHLNFESNVSSTFVPLHACRPHAIMINAINIITLHTFPAIFSYVEVSFVQRLMFIVFDRYEMCVRIMIGRKWYLYYFCLLYIVHLLFFCCCFDLNRFVLFLFDLTQIRFF